MEDKHILKLYNIYEKYNKLYEVSKTKLDFDQFSLLVKGLNYVLINAVELEIKPKDIELRLRLSYHLEPINNREILSLYILKDDYGVETLLDTTLDKRYDSSDMFLDTVYDFLSEFPSMNEVVSRFLVDDKNYLLDIINIHLDKPINESKLESLLSE